MLVKLKPRDTHVPLSKDPLVVPRALVSALTAMFTRSLERLKGRLER